MKLVFKLVAIALFFLLAIGMLIGASIWEGTAAVAPDGVLPHTGYYAATNAFPRDTVVIVANLENGKTIQVAVAAALDNSSVLILLSREAADAIALSANYPGRVRLMEAIDPVTMLPPMENKISNGDPDYDPMARISSASPNSPASALTEAGGVPAEEVVAEDDAPSPLPEEGDAPVLVEAGGVPADAEAPVIYSDDYNLALVPAEDRAPVGEKGVVIPLDEQIPPIAIHQEQEQPLDPASFIASIEDALTLSAGSQSQDVASARSSANFSVPMITSMEKGKYYVQLRSYSRPELVESELVKIGKQRNLAVQMTELSGRQLYRILIGPVSHDESSQLLRQYKAKGWGDAFVWLGK